MAKLNERLVADQAASLGAGGLGYTPRQLYYAICRELEGPEVTSGTAQAAIGALLALVGLVFGILASVYLVLLLIIGVVMCAVGLQNRRRELNRPTTRPLALGYDEFVREVVEPRRTGQVAPPPGLILDENGTGRAATPADAGEKRPVVVCDRAETVALLEAMSGTAGFAVHAVSEAQVATLPRADRVFTLHDADPSGCALPLRVRERFDGEVVDIGLRPSHLVHRRIQVIEGAPALVPRELGALLTPAELVWLAEGRRVELAVLTPQELLEGIRRAVSGGAVQPPGLGPAGLALAEVPLLIPEPPRTPAATA